MILADTGFLIALARKRDILHDRALRWSNAVRAPVVVTDYVIWETVNALSVLSERGICHVLLEHVQSDPGYEIVAATQVLTNAGVKLHADRPDKEWSLTDCISFVVMEEREITEALAYDHHFIQAGFDALLRRDPE